MDIRTRKEPKEESKEESLQASTKVDRLSEVSMIALLILLI